MISDSDRAVADRVYKARAASQLTSDPYVLALVTVADAAAYYFDMRFRARHSPPEDRITAERQLYEAETRLKALIGWVSHGIVERAIGRLGEGHDPPPKWQSDVWNRIEMQKIEPKRIGIRGWWRALWARRRM